MPEANAAAAAYSLSVSASAPSGTSKRLAVQLEDQLELTERDLWEDDAGTVILACSLGSIMLATYRNYRQLQSAGYSACCCVLILGHNLTSDLHRLHFCLYTQP